MPKITKVKDFIFYKNKKLKDRYGNLHPSIDLGVSNDGKWINIPITSSPTKKGRYIEFDENPDPTKRQKKNGSNVYPSFLKNMLDTTKFRISQVSMRHII